MTTLNDILITEKLFQRSPRPPNWQAENQALHTLAQQLVHQPEIILQTLVDMALDLCNAGTAGVSMLETTTNGAEIFRWNALAGTLAHHVGGTTPRNFSPCGICLDHGTPVLFSHPERYFTDFQATNTPIVEGLVLPLVAAHHPLGTLWILSHDEQQQFDSEDVRVMRALSNLTMAFLLNQRQTQELLSVVSHELQSPLVAILGWTRLLRANPPTPGMLSKALDTIERNATVQAKLIQDLLDISRISAGKLRLNVQPVEMESVIESAIATVSQTAKAKGLNLVLKAQGRRQRAEGKQGDGKEDGNNGYLVGQDRASLTSNTEHSLVVMGDRDRLGQIMSNLLTNAIKFTPDQGCITIELSALKGDNGASAAYAEISITDTGIGIAADFLPHVFDRFCQAERSSSSGGLGLGLAIARHLVELHGGTIHAVSAGTGQGATFIIKLPLIDQQVQL